MQGSAARRAMARIAARQDWPRSRGDRFLEGGRTKPSFVALASLPRWPVLDDAPQRRVATVAQLIASQYALSRLIDGAQLRAYALLVGASVFERILMHDDGGRTPLPSPDRMPEAAQDLLMRAAEDGDACRWLVMAETLLKEMDAWPST